MLEAVGPFSYLEEAIFQPDFDAKILTIKPMFLDSRMKNRVSNLGADTLRNIVIIRYIVNFKVSIHFGKLA